MVTVVDVLGWIAVAVGLLTLAAGMQEIRTRRPIFRRIGTRPDTVRQHGWLCVAIGAMVALNGLSGVLDLPWWFDAAVLVAVLALGTWAAFAHRPAEPAGRRVDPPPDPDAVWKRSPPGY